MSIYLLKNWIQDQISYLEGCNFEALSERDTQKTNELIMACENAILDLCVYADTGEV